MPTCRRCKQFESRHDSMVHYSTRHYMHPACYLDAGKKLEDLRPWQVGRFPYFLLKERGLLEQAQQISGMIAPNP